MPPEILQANEFYWLIIATAALIGACIGSFITMASWRLPREESLLKPASHCPACNHTLGARDLFPILSWVASRGRCRYCKAAVHWRYPAIEAVCAAGFAIIAAHFGLGWQAACIATLFGAVVLMIVTDLENWMIPDEVHLLLLPLGLAYRALGNADWTWGSLLAGPLAGLITGLTLHYGYFWLRKRHGLGLGDVKFFATAGAWLGALPLAPYFFYSGLAGIVFALGWRMVRRGHDDEGYFPFGPALAVMLLVGVVFPETLHAFFAFFQPHGNM